MIAFCSLDESEFAPGAFMLARMGRLYSRNSVDRFPSANRRHSMPQAIISCLLALSQLRSRVVERSRLLIASASCVIQST